jgi:hypothetical protein
MNQERDEHSDDEINIEDHTRSGALYILKIQEECSLTKSTVAKVLANTKDIVRETLSTVETQVQDCLRDFNIDYHNVPGLQDIFMEDNMVTNPFHNLETPAQQLAYFKNEFELKVRTIFSGGLCLHYS